MPPKRNDEKPYPDINFTLKYNIKIAPKFPNLFQDLYFNTTLQYIVFKLPHSYPSRSRK